ncbi:MAG: alcohol dehydrogenase catalytic domain-containing protein [Bilophila wadsworthia]|uniref:alcohol dehydrogenase catalytic domain-containing protein n=1 Tax=Bilophila wadsworthia TaxID=35833 RepID=UPI00300E978E
MQSAPAYPGLVPGQRKVIINPTDECGTCGYCRSGHRRNLCRISCYYGSAARTPHVQGMIVEYPMVQARQCVAVSDAMPLDQAACVEPLAIALHAVARAGESARQAGVRQRGGSGGAASSPPLPT